MADPKATLASVLNTWFEKANPDASEEQGEHTFRLDDWLPEEEAPPPKEESPWRGHYIQQEVAKGGMGVIYEATQDRLRRSVALKTPNSPMLYDRFAEEAMISGHLNHPNIITVHDLIRSDENALGMTMPLIDGSSWKQKLMEDHIRGQGTLSEQKLREHLDYLLKVCQAVSYAHHKGILHNDLKLDNVMVGDFGDVVVMDWGCATQNPNLDVQLPFSILHPNRIDRPFGSPCYMPPELACGDGKRIGPWTDTYLIGTMLYEIIEGRTPRRGRTLGEVIERACRGEIDPFQQCRSHTLRKICQRAIAAETEQRYQSPEEFERVLRGYFRAEQSEALIATANAVLQAEEQVLATPETESHTRIATLIEVVSMFQQANQLWSSEQAKSGEIQACRKLIERAIDMGDLDISEAYFNRLNKSKHGDLEALLQRAKLRRQNELQAFKRSRRLTTSVVVLVFLGLIFAGLLINQARQKAVFQEQIAQERLAELSSLSDVQSAQQLMEEVQELWPLRDQQVPKLKAWLSKANVLLQRKDQHQQHYDSLMADELQMRPQIRAWELGIVSTLLEGLGKLEMNLVPEVQERLEFAQHLRRRTIEEQEENWAEAISSIKRSPIYQGLDLSPQLGLIPLRQDPRSGLWEFAHLQSGELPGITETGYERTPNTGIVLVLIPRSSFWMGAQREGDTNVDPRAKDTEGPVHLVDLDHFFLSKYEMTQAQWTRIRQSNPSAYPVGTEVKPKSITGDHPIEQVTWSESVGALKRYDLVLPTEAQWEYAARGISAPDGAQPSSNRVFWTGNDVTSLQGTLNISDVGGRSLGSPESWRFEAALNDGHIVHAPVGSFSPNPFGLHDMLGNVWEWCSDRFGSYTLPTEKGTGRRQIVDEEAPRLFRGGGFRASSVHVRSADRYSIYASDYRAYDVGLRPARAVE